MRRGFLCLMAIMDWSARKLPAWRISNTLGTDFCVEALNEAIHRFGAPDIMNPDQGSQFTSFAWTDRLKRAGIRISMNGKRRCIDNPRAFTRTNGVHALDMSRLWRSLKYECVYLHARDTGSQAKAGIGNRITFYNHQPHAALGGTPPAVFNRRTITATQPDRQAQAVAQISRKTVQRSGNSSVSDGSAMPIRCRFIQTGRRSGLHTGPSTALWRSDGCHEPRCRIASHWPGRRRRA